MAEEMGLPDSVIDTIGMAGRVHDIGKISVPSEILSKPSRLNENEMNLIKDHSNVGFAILNKVRFQSPIAEIVRQHHERMNGSGYPEGLSGQDILPEARIISVADVVEAISSHRPYRPALGIDKALEEIAKSRGVLYDSDVVDACLRLFTKKGYKFQ
jgi:HD-GYP domain-containing protein (c-di-GMP phosphodiesterase class II)